MKLKLPQVEMFGIDIVKNFLLFCLFFVIFIVLLVYVVTPTIQKFRETKKEYYIVKIKADEIQNRLDRLTNQYKKLYKDNHKIVLAFKREFNKYRFTAFASQYMRVLNIEDKNISTYKKRFIKKSYIVSATLKSPKGFYKLIDNLNRVPNVLKVYYPVAFKAKNGDIKLLYKIETFQEAR